ncbi:hypothetical protein LCGC14_2234120, partial [marine sediment metagenome]
GYFSGSSLSVEARPPGWYDRGVQRAEVLGNTAQGPMTDMWRTRKVACPLFLPFPSFLLLPEITHVERKIGMKATTVAVVLISCVALVILAGSYCWFSRLWRPLTPLHRAAAQGNLAQIRALLANGADINAPDKRGWTPLCWALFHTRAEAAKLLIASGADLRKGSPLHFAADEGLTEIVLTFLSRGVPVDARDGGGATVLAAAPRHGQDEVVQALLAKGADANATDATGSTSIREAAQWGHGSTVKLLLAAGADVKTRDQWGYTALHVAAMNGHLGIVKVLLGAGADPSATSTDGYTPLSLARDRGRSKVVSFLTNR